MAIFEKDYQVNILNVGASNSITNMGILSIFEDIACKHSDTVSFGINDIQTTHLSWVVLFWKIKLLKRVPYGTKIKVYTWAKPANKFHTYRDFEVQDESGNVICLATSKWTLIDLEKSAIVPITDDVINRYQPEIEKESIASSEIEKLSGPDSYSYEYTYTVQRRDIDVNQHMNNLNYLFLAYEALPEHIYFSTECNNVEIMYKKSIKLGDTVKCFYSYAYGAHYITIKSLDEKNIHAIIKLYN